MSQRLFQQLLTALALVLDLEERRKLYHGWRVGLTASRLASLLRPEKTALLFYAGLLHDLGAIGLDDHIIHYPRLADQLARPEILSHVQRTATIFSLIPGLEGMAQAVSEHHEWWNGTGYPRQLKGEEISLEGQILRAADALDLWLRAHVLAPDPTAEVGSGRPQGEAGHPPSPAGFLAGGQQAAMGGSLGRSQEAASGFFVGSPQGSSAGPSPGSQHAASAGSFPSSSLDILDLRTKAIKFLQEHRGTEFSPRVADALAELLATPDFLPVLLVEQDLTSVIRQETAQLFLPPEKLEDGGGLAAAPGVTPKRGPIPPGSEPPAAPGQGLVSGGTAPWAAQEHRSVPAGSEPPAAPEQAPVPGRTEPPVATGEAPAPGGTAPPVAPAEPPVSGGPGQAAVSDMNRSSSALDPDEILFSRMNSAIDRVIKVFAQVIDAKHSYTAGHSERVTLYAVLLAEEMGLTPAQLNTLTVASLLHDAGKVAVPRRILDKPSRLDDEERRIIETHPGYTIEILSTIDDLRFLAAIAGGHHERFDGRGYPYGLAGENIPFLARIMAVADAFDAMTSHRPYQRNRTVEEALTVIARGAGTQFDPDLAAVAQTAYRGLDPDQYRWKPAWAG